MSIKTKYLIPLINCIVILVTWLLILIIFGQTKEESSNAFYAILNELVTSLLIINYISMMLLTVFSISFLGTIFFYYRKKMDLFQGFRNSLLINLLIIVVLIIIAQFQ